MGIAPWNSSVLPLGSCAVTKCVSVGHRTVFWCHRRAPPIAQPSSRSRNARWSRSGFPRGATGRSPSVPVRCGRNDIEEHDFDRVIRRTRGDRLGQHGDAIASHRSRRSALAVDVRHRRPECSAPDVDRVSRDPVRPAGRDRSGRPRRHPAAGPVADRPVAGLRR